MAVREGAVAIYRFEGVQKVSVLFGLEVRESYGLWPVLSCDLKLAARCRETIAAAQANVEKSD